MGPPRKRASSKASNGGPTAQKKHKTNNSLVTPSLTEPSKDWIEEKSLNTDAGKTEANGSEGCGMKVAAEDQSDPNRMNEENSGLANLSSVMDSNVQHTNLKKDDQEKADINQFTNREPARHSFSRSISTKLHEPLQDQNLILEVKKENQSVSTEPEDKKIKSYACFCGKSYTSTSHLNRHRKIHVSEEQLTGGRDNGEIGEKKTSEQRFTCHCGKHYTSKSNLKRHRNSCSQQAQNKIKQEKKEKAVIHHHVEDQEEKIKPYVCACGKSYTCSSHLYRHQRRNLDSTNQNECGKAYIYRHQKTNTEEKVLVEGKKEVEDPEETPSSEEKVKPYKCFCGKRYTCSSHLNRHQKTHKVNDSPLRENRYKCKCGKSYTCSSHLYRHLRTHEQFFSVEDNDVDRDSEVDIEGYRQKPYKCECGKSFILSFSLLLHKKIHCRWKNNTDGDPTSQ
ncbi:uncharacterized protein [Pyxicephalus adspersus]|uniref:C2H2-type domain-containing protein n=1 Tax=Pyxicephalus adspersus TaxID=30357 RepID=A0AAV3ABZ5_PYXAD|nr:TPA: hypothetical protein GDO54_017348 [Pyxicephalus adspersus]